MVDDIFCVSKCGFKSYMSHAFITFKISWPTAVLECRPPRCFHYSKDIYLQTSSYYFRSAQTHPSILHSLSAQGTNLSHVKPPFVFKFQQTTPGLNNCDIKWVSNSPHGKGSYIVSSTSTHYGLNFKRTLPPLYLLVTDQWPMAQTISIETLLVLTHRRRFGMKNLKRFGIRDYDITTFDTVELSSGAINGHLLFYNLKNLRMEDIFSFVNFGLIAEICYFLNVTMTFVQGDQK